MLKILFSCFLLTCNTNFSFAAPHQVKSKPLTIPCSPQLQDSLDTILKLPEVRDLISVIQKEGPFRFAVKNTHLSEKFGAFWDMNNRVICVGISPCISKGEIIGSMLFELHNALVNSQLNQLDDLVARRKISKEAYVEAVERLEYKNSLNASSLATKGIRLGIFPESAHLFTYSSFEEHYRIQKMAGHSAWIAKTYDQIVQDSV